MKKGLVIFSGGQDSVTTLGVALKECDAVECITFSYGQKHFIEIQQAKKICEILGIKQTIISMGFLDSLVDSALTSNGDVNELNEKGLPSSFVPNRNQLFITLAHAYAQKIRAGHLYTGVCQTDYSGYPDCRDEFIKAIESATNLGSQSDIEIHTPMMFINKAETFKLAKDVGVLDIVINHSHTCYNGDRVNYFEWGYGCGECPACELREKGWIEYNQKKA